jgi:hypothetical protein
VSDARSHGNANIRTDSDSYAGGQCVAHADTYAGANFDYPGWSASNTGTHRFAGGQYVTGAVANASSNAGC